MPFQKAYAQTLCSESQCLRIGRGLSRDPSGYAAGDRERSEITLDVPGIKDRTRERANRSGNLITALAKGGVVEIGTKHRHGGLQRLGADRCLAPTSHLRVKPGGLGGIGP